MMKAEIGLRERVFCFMLYAGLGITTEVFFTAIVQLIASSNLDDLRLKGFSYVWMFPIYGSASILFPIFYRILKKYNRILRYLAYALTILLVELITGFLLEKITGTCPWEYQEGWQIGGYIRLDYLPLWMLFGAVIEEFHRFNQRIGIA